MMIYCEARYIQNKKAKSSIAADKEQPINKRRDENKESKNK